jgi:hypothetical protein
MRLIRNFLLWVRYLGARPMSEMHGYHAGLIAGRESANAQWVREASQLICAANRHLYESDHALKTMSKHQVPILSSTHPEQWADLEHSRLRLERAISNARRAIRAVKS